MTKQTIYLTIPYMYEIKCILKEGSAFEHMKFASLGLVNDEPRIIILGKYTTEPARYYFMIYKDDKETKLTLKNVLKYTGKGLTLTRILMTIDIVSSHHLSYHDSVVLK